MKVVYKESKKCTSKKRLSNKNDDDKTSNTIQPFFMVFADKPNNYNKIPTVRHTTEEEAEAEALRIADKEKCECYVVKSVKKVSLITNVETIN